MSSSQSSERRIPDSPCMRAVGLLIRVMRRHHACVERRIGDLSIHHGQHRMLMKLACRQGDIPSQKELAEIMGISPAAVTATLKKLEREEYIARSMTDEDNRRNEHDGHGNTGVLRKNGRCGPNHLFQLALHLAEPLRHALEKAGLGIVLLDGSGNGLGRSGVRFLFFSH